MFANPIKPQSSLQHTSPVARTPVDAPVSASGLYPVTPPPVAPRRVPVGTPTSAQRDALQRFADANGLAWKTKLLLAWEHGRDLSENDGQHLRQVRDNLGAPWLVGRTNTIRPRAAAMPKSEREEGER